MKLQKNLNNIQIAELLRNVAAAYQLKDEVKNKFKIAAYDRAADAVEHATSELKDLWDDGKLDEVPGIGPGIASHLDELFRKGKSKHFELLLKGIPSDAFKLMELPGIGIKTALKLIKEQPKNEIKKMLSEVEKKNKERRLLLPYAVKISSLIIDWIRKEPLALRVEPLGSLRRKVATIGDIDIAVASTQPKKVIEHFSKYPKTVKVLEKGDVSCSIIVPGDIQVDLMVQKPKGFGSLLQHLTGSKHHNIALREFALKKSLSLSEYGIRPVKNLKRTTGTAVRIKKFRDEKSFYNFLGLEYIEPELREDAGEIEAAFAHKLPKLVKLTDVKSDLQIHSNFDIETSHDLGASSMQDIIEKGNQLGYEYLAFTEHNPSKSKHSQKQIVDILKRKREAVDKINYSIVNSVKSRRKTTLARVKKVFNSLEIDIMPDGSVPVSNEGLNTLDFALVSIHSSFGLSRDKMTRRVISALMHPKIKIFAHPTARKLNEREGIELDWPKIFDFCIKNNKWLEINADPARLDLPDTLVREAIKSGVKLTLGTDAHHKDHMDNMIYGVWVARRGWARANDIINTLKLKDFEKGVNKK